MWLLLSAVGSIAVAVAAVWYRTNANMFMGSIRPGEEYRVGNRVYQMPNLPIVDSRGNSLSALPLIAPEYQERMRTLLQKVISVLRRRNIEHFVSGGTLLGMVRHGTFHPADDDEDGHLVHWKDREYVWSQQFVDDCAEEGLEVFHLRWGSLNRAPKFGNSTGIRCRLKGIASPTFDLFFEKEVIPGTLAKIESWNGDEVEMNHREIWSKSDVLPIQWKTIDGMEVPLPANPERLLKTQYGKDCLEVVRFDGIWWAHAFFFKVLTPIWKFRTSSHEK